MLDCVYYYYFGDTVGIFSSAFDSLSLIFALAHAIPTLEMYTKLPLLAQWNNNNFMCRRTSWIGNIKHAFVL